MTMMTTTMKSSTRSCCCPGNILMRRWFHSELMSSSSSYSTYSSYLSSQYYIPSSSQVLITMNNKNHYQQFQIQHRSFFIIITNNMNNIQRNSNIFINTNINISTNTNINTKKINIHKRCLSSSTNHQHYYHNINEALQILNLQNKTNYTPLDLRDAYFAAAKLCHPDSKTNNNKNSSNNDDDCTMQFLKVTEAYELLQSNLKTKTNNYQHHHDNHYQDGNNYIIPKSNEQNYRDACKEYLGLDAETVEESKRCPLFREWLKGKTDAAYHWNRFFMVHGGLAPMLNVEKVLRVTDGGGGGRIRRRRKRK